MGKELYVTSEAIEAIRKRLEDTAKPRLKEAKDKVDEVGLDFPYFGIAGIPLQFAHGNIQDYAKDYFQAGYDQLEVWRGKLADAKKTWQEAEQKSTVVAKD